MTTLVDRDCYHEAADDLTDAIAKHFGQDFGEHSNANSPWANALGFLENPQPEKSDPIAEKYRKALEEIFTIYDKASDHITLSHEIPVAAQKMFQVARKALKR